MEEKFLLEVKGDGFTLTMQGFGDSAKAAEAVSTAFDGLAVEARSFGDEVDMSGH